jgi:hypothetical protein
MLVIGSCFESEVMDHLSWFQPDCILELILHLIWVFNVLLPFEVIICIIPFFLLKLWVVLCRLGATIWHPLACLCIFEESRIIFINLCTHFDKHFLWIGINFHGFLKIKNHFLLLKQITLMSSEMKPWLPVRNGEAKWFT